MRLYLKLCFLGVLLLHVALLKLTVVIPVRTMALFAFVGLLFLVHHRQFVDFTKRNSTVFAVFVAMAFLGGFLAFLQGEQIRPLAENLLRHIIQPALILMSVYLAIEVLGFKFVANSLLAFVGLSAGVAILQFLGIDLAWDLRRLFGSIQGDPADIRQLLRTGARPMGLVFTPILFSYHLVSGYVIANMLYRQGLMQAQLYAPFTVALLFAAAASGTRSLVLGIVVHEALQLALRGGVRSFVWLAVGAVVAVGGFYFFQAAGSRVVSVEDASAVSRMALFKFGLQLFLDNPFGFGWGVNPAEHAWLYWEQLSHLPKASAVYRLGIHNAFINFLLQYGVFGVGVFALLAALHLRDAIALVVSFLAYFINAMFHNAGVFVGELFFWFSFAVFLYLNRSSEEMPLTAGQR